MSRIKFPESWMTKGVSYQGCYDKYTPIDNMLEHLRDMGYHAERNSDTITMDCPTFMDLDKAIRKPPKNVPSVSIDVAGHLMNQYGCTREEAIVLLKDHLVNIRWKETGQ